MVWFLLLLGLIIFVTLSLTREKYDEISFKQSIDLCNVPVITLYQGDKKFNFLLDTGADDCVIHSKYLDNIKYELTDYVTSHFGLDGQGEEVKICNIDLFYNKQEYRSEFVIRDLSNIFDIIKQDSGVTLHGVLGSRFFAKYKYILDFDKFVAFSKEK